MRRSMLRFSSPGYILAFALVVVATFLMIGTAHPKAQAFGSPLVDVLISRDGTGTVATDPFNTAAPGDVLVAFVAADGPAGGGQTVTVSGAGLGWNLVKRVNTRLGTSEIWSATASSILSGAVVTSTEGLSGFDQSLTIVAFTNAGGIGASAVADGANGAPSVSVTSTKAGSVVYGVGNDWDNAVPRTVGAGQAKVHENLAPSGSTFWVQNLVDAVTSAGTTVQLNDTAPTADRWNFAAVEIVPPQAPGFLVVAYNDTLTIGLSDTVTYDMLVSPFGGFTGPLTCDVTAIPAGATGTMEPPGGPPHPGPIAMTVTTGPATASGTYHPVVTCSAGTVSASTTLTLVVTSLPDVRIVLQPNSLTLTQGQVGFANFQIQAMNGFAQSVNLSVTGLPAGVSPTFTPSALVPTGGGTLQLNVGASTAVGIYQLVVRATPTSGTQRQAPFTLTVQQPNGSGSWRQQALGQTPALFYGSIVGDPGNTGRNRVYASGGNGLMYEYSFNGTAWSFSRIPFGVTGDGEMHNGGVGPGHNDGVNRLYIAANLSGQVYEASWVNGAWQTTVIANFPSATDVIVGDGRNDGHMRVYVSWGSGATELTWTGSAWTQVTMGSGEGGEVHCIDLATGRNDGINRLYTSNDANGQVSEYSWNGSTWTKVTMGVNSDVRNIQFGDGRNDGRIRGYAASADGNVYEYTWSGTAWQNVSIGNAGVAGIKVHANPIKARGDNINRIYAAAADGGVYEYFWTGSSWQTAKLGSATAYMYGLDSGDGLNKGTTQLYGSSYDGNEYLFEWIPANPPSLVTVPSLVGLQQGSVAGVLSNVGLIVGTSTNQDNLTALIGVVLGQSPTGGTQAPQGSAVNLTVSAGVAVPNVVGSTQSNAINALAGVNLDATISSATSATVPQGSVITSNPIAGVHVSGGSSVALVVSSGPPPPVNVPDVVGQPLATAQSLIVGANLTLGTTTNQSSATVPNGSVISQTPTGGTPVPGGTAVSLVVSTGPAPAFGVDSSLSSDGAGTRTLTGFSTSSSGDLLLAFVGADGPGGGGQTATVSGAGLSWTLVRRVNVQQGTSEIWKATATGVLSNASITSTLSSSTFHQSLTVAAFKGASGTAATAGTSAATGAPTVSLTTTQPGSFVYGVGNDWDRAVARAVPAGQAKVHEWVDTAVGDTFWVQNRVASVAAVGTIVQLNDTAPTADRWNFAAVEIVVSAGSAPVITSATTASGTVGVAFTYQITATNAPTSFGATGLPAGLSVNTGTGLISGTPTAAGTSTVTLSATNGGGPGTATLTLTIAPARPVISSPTTASGTVGVAFTYQITATNAPTSFGATGLPAGLSVNTGTGLISGTPTTAGTSTVTLSATNGGGSGTATLTLTIAPAPVGITIDATVSFARSTTGATIASGAFSTTAANELLLALIAADNLSGTTTITNVTGAGLTWQLVRRTNTQRGAAEIWRAFAPTALTGVTATATISQAVAASITVMSFKGVDTSGTAGSGAVGATGTGASASGAPTATLTTTRANSLVVGVGHDWDHATARTVGANQTLVHQYLATVGDTFWVQRTTNVVPLAGTSVTINDTAPTTDRYNLTICEVLRAP